MASNIPKQCKAAVFEKKGAPLTIKQVEVPQPGPSEVLVKVLACGVCHTDAFIGAGAFGEVFPRIPGHELIGDVVSLGSEVTKWKVGDRVGGPWHGGHDGFCKQCNRGQFQMSVDRCS